MFANIDSVMWQIFCAVGFCALAVFIICFILYIIIFICILIKRIIFGVDTQKDTDEKKDDSKDAVVGFDLQNNNIRRE